VNAFIAREFWRFVIVQQYVAKLAQTANGRGSVISGSPLRLDNCLNS